jgi:two-component system cell cycle response regulator
MPDADLTHIVLAEDDPASRALLARQLRKAGFQVIACENGKEALAAVRREVRCLVVADWTMPEMDGLELCRAVRSLTEMHALSFVYFILLTAHTDTDQIVAGLEAGADDYLTKPYHKQELLARLRTGVRLCNLQAELINRQIELHRANRELGVLARKLEILASTDELTGVANRRSLFKRFAEAWALAERNDQPLGCILFDIDRFKLINDTHGHAAGDAVLKELSARCEQVLRASDVLGRIGGEEFCVICPVTSAEGAAHLAERLRARVAQTVFSITDAAISVTISLGVAGRRPVHTGPDELTREADAMLYRAKDSGRNQVWVSDHNGAACCLNALSRTS